MWHAAAPALICPRNYARCKENVCSGFKECIFFGVILTYYCSSMNGALEEASLPPLSPWFSQVIVNVCWMRKEWNYKYAQRVETYACNAWFSGGLFLGVGLIHKNKSNQRKPSTGLGKASNAIFFPYNNLSQINGQCDSVCQFLSRAL